MNHARLDPHRRRFLRSGAALAAALGAGTLGNLMLATRSAHAADYKALVCVFLHGGNDGLNTIVPFDAARHAQYASVRADLAVPRSALIGLEGTSFGLHPALGALAGAANAGQLAPVFNVGPLRQPLTKAQFRGASLESGAVPGSLFSHSDQQVLWECASADVLERTGWGGRAADVLATVNPVIAVGEPSRFGQSAAKSALVLPRPGDIFGAVGLQAEDMSSPAQVARRTAIDVLYAQPQDLLLAEIYSSMQQDAFGMSARLGALVRSAPGSVGSSPVIDAAFAPLISGGAFTSWIAAQLYQIAKLIDGNAVVQGNRQIFFARHGDFDTHAGQAVAGSPTEGAHARVLKELGDALAAFQTAMGNLGLDDAVTAFTQSDFGRTLTPNSSGGTDHGWGNHQLVLGGAVRGGTTYGTYPELVPGGPDDVGVEGWELQGRWIPTTSVDQYAATLLGWFGASPGQLDSILPNLRNFPMRNLGFL